MPTTDDELLKGLIATRGLLRQCVGTYSQRLLTPIPAFGDGQDSDATRRRGVPPRGAASAVVMPRQLKHGITYRGPSTDSCVHYG